jgi:DNA-binding NarL/FixJ family response regulator
MKKITPLTTTRIINVIHIDDDPLFLSVVKQILEKNSSIQIAHQFTNPHRFLDAYAQICQNDVIIMDFKMPQMNGLDLLAKLKERKNKMPVISFSAHTFPEYIEALENSGVRYCLQKSEVKNIEALIIKCSTKGDSTSGSFNNKLLSHDDITLLTFICRHHTIHQISEKIFIGEEAVRKRKSALAKKIGILNQSSHFQLWAIQHGYMGL